MADQASSHSVPGPNCDHRFAYLVFSYLDGVCSEDEFQELQEALHREADKRDMFVSLCLQISQLRELERPQQARPDPEENPSSLFTDANAGDVPPVAPGVSDDALPAQSTDEAYWELHAQREAIKRAAERAFSEFKERELRRQEELALRQYRARQRRMYIGFSCAAVLMIIMGLAWLAEYKSRALPDELVVSPPKPVIPPVLAHISKSRHARWQGGVLPVNPGTAIRASSLRLEEGLVEMVFAGGAYALLQAPCDIRLETAEQVFLGGGSLAIEIPDRANGFVVRTPTSTVVDYGTEFGVMVYATGETEAQVYQGKVALRSGSDPVRSEASQMMLAEQAGRVDRDGRISWTPFQAERMFRVIPPKMGLAIPGVRLSLMDMLIAGNGFDTGKTERVLNVRTGASEQLEAGRRNVVVRDTQGSGVPWSSFVDYLFVPDGGNGPLKISSQDHAWADCPDTDGTARALIAYRGFLRDHIARIDDMVLQGRVYDNPEYPALAMHANRGISFDLDAIRASLPGLRIAQFSALCGVSETAGRTRSQGCDFWVLLDGQTAYQRLGVNIDSGTESISLACPESARFLSLAVTDGGNGSGFDWGVFAEPVLELEAQATGTTPSSQ